MSTTDIQQNGSSNPQEIKWQAHPACQNFKKAVFAVAVIAIMALLIGIITGSNLWALFACVILILALQRFFFPSHFIINEKLISANYLLGTKSLQWKYIRRFTHDANGGYLSTRKIASRLDAYRGMHIYFNYNRQLIIPAIEDRIRVAIS
ncbi:MAG: hypothetical protein HQ528_01040 [Candidatus Marinimicrobia bacterium]|nr:hypothetical protein [Candidatus Neomarinimicrobiota bacterium]